MMDYDFPGEEDPCWEQDNEYEEEGEGDEDDED